MPLPVAHGLVGASVVAAIHPSAAPDLRWKPLLWGAVLANAPDLDFLLEWGLHWSHVHRTFTHSLLFSLLVGGVIFWSLGRARWKEAVAYSGAYFSHLLLDFSATKVTEGVMLFWPVSTEQYRLGLLGLSEFREGFHTLDAFLASFVEVLGAALQELAIFLPVFLVAYTYGRARVPGFRFEEKAA